MNGLEALIFIAEGDMRNALNALQSTVSGFETVTAENVFKVSIYSGEHYVCTMYYVHFMLLLINICCASVLYVYVYPIYYVYHMLCACLYYVCYSLLIYTV